MRRTNDRNRSDAKSRNNQKERKEEQEKNPDEEKYVVIIRNVNPSPHDIHQLALAKFLRLNPKFSEQHIVKSRNEFVAKRRCADMLKQKEGEEKSESDDEDDGEFSRQPPKYPVYSYDIRVRSETQTAEVRLLHNLPTASPEDNDPELIQEVLNRSKTKIDDEKKKKKKKIIGEKTKREEMEEELHDDENFHSSSDDDSALEEEEDGKKKKGRPPCSTSLQNISEQCQEKLYFSRHHLKYFSDDSKSRNKKETSKTTTSSSSSFGQKGQEEEIAKKMQGVRQGLLVSASVQLSIPLGPNQLTKYLTDLPGFISCWKTTFYPPKLQQQKTTAPSFSNHENEGNKKDEEQDQEGGKTKKKKGTVEAGKKKQEGSREEGKEKGEEKNDHSAMMVTNATTSVDMPVKYRVVFKDVDSLFAAKALLDEFEAAKGLRLKVELSENLKDRYTQYMYDQAAVSLS